MRNRATELILWLPFFKQGDGQKVVLKDQREEIPDSKQALQNLQQTKTSSGNAISILLHFEEKLICRESF